MADREKIIKAIETHLSTDISVGCDDCTYDNDGWCTTRLLADILALLKEQESVPPDVDSEGSCSCGNCGATVGYYPAGCKTPEKLCKLCPECGRPVKWE